MIDLDTVATFMISIVTHYFARCGESLETMLEENEKAWSTSTTSSQKAQTPDNDAEHVAACSVDGTSICHSFDIYHGLDTASEREPFAIQKVDGTDLIFFPTPVIRSALPK